MVLVLCIVGQLMDKMMRTDIDLVSLYNGIYVYTTVGQYFSLQWKISLLCRCLHDDDVVLYPGIHINTSNVNKAG